MKLKAVISNTAPKALFEAFKSPLFARKFLTEVVGEALGVENPLARPGEFYVQEPDPIVAIDDSGVWGIELRLTGVSRNGRKAAMFHNALKALNNLARRTIAELFVSEGDLSDAKVQLFSVLMLDGEIESAPGSGRYTNVLETPAEWVMHDPLSRSDVPPGDEHV